MNKSDPEHELIVFDGHCVFCWGFAQFVIHHDKEGWFRFVSMQSVSLQTPRLPGVLARAERPAA